MCSLFPLLYLVRWAAYSSCCSSIPKTLYTHRTDMFPASYFHSKYERKKKSWDQVWRPFFPIFRLCHVWCAAVLLFFKKSSAIFALISQQLYARPIIGSYLFAPLSFTSVNIFVKKRSWNACVRRFYCREKLDVWNGSTLIPDDHFIKKTRGRRRRRKNDKEDRLTGRQHNGAVTSSIPDMSDGQELEQCTLPPPLMAVPISTREILSKTVSLSFLIDSSPWPTLCVSACSCRRRHNVTMYVF